MPWKATSPMDLRRELMNRLFDGEKLVDLCQEYGISRKTGQKFKARFEQQGIEGLYDLPRAPKVIPHKTPQELVDVIVDERKLHPSWGPKKLKDVIERRLGRELPAASTIGDILERAGLVDRRRPRRQHQPMPTMLTEAIEPNQVWCIDYKGQFQLGNRSYCYPLTITDQFSRFILCCEGMAAISDEEAREVCQDVFRTYGLPSSIRSDNGVPFACNGLAGLTKLSTYWLRLGIRLERIRPGHPQENGRHERMHRTLKQETTRPAREHLLQQQEAFDVFVDEFNTIRPHEALAMKRPCEVYTASPKLYPERLPELEYSTHDEVLLVGKGGFLNMPRTRTVYLSRALEGQHVGLRECDDGRWLVTFMSLDLGHIQPVTKNFVSLTPTPN
jgi:transposase InsO family protein